MRLEMMQMVLQLTIRKAVYPMTPPILAHAHVKLNNNSSNYLYPDFFQFIYSYDTVGPTGFTKFFPWLLIDDRPVGYILEPHCPMEMNGVSKGTQIFAKIFGERDELLKIGKFDIK